MYCSSLTPIYMLEIFDNFPADQETLVAWFWWGVSLLSLGLSAKLQQNAQTCNLHAKSGIGHDLMISCSRTFTEFL
jgi:hypothetical protein